MRLALLLVIALNIGVFGVMVGETGGMDFSARTLLAWGGNLGLLTLGGELAGRAEPWRLLTATYLHVGLLHLAGNMLLLFVTGRAIQDWTGQVTFLAAYTLCGVAASVCSALGNPEVVSVGASGAVAGLVGMLVAFYFSGRFPGINGGALAQTVGLNALFSFAPNVDWLAHLGGFVAGLIVGAALLAFHAGLRGEGAWE